jgi:protein-disulfide isomerase
LAAVFSVCSLGLAIVSAVFVRAYCIMCIASHAVSFLLLFFLWLLHRRYFPQGVWTSIASDIRHLFWEKKKAVGPALLFVGALIAAGCHAFPDYWEYNPSSLATDIPRGVTAEGHPWIGAVDGGLEITEYSDYLCFQCRKMHHYLRGLVARYPEKIRLVHRHFPMDHQVNKLVKEPFHVGAGWMALAAIYAAEEGRFWEMNDVLFERATPGTIDVQELARLTGLDADALGKALATRDDLRLKLARDVWSGIKLEISGTPSFVIDGRVYHGNIPPEIIRDAIQ